jgi:hypothetical protein
MDKIQGADSYAALLWATMGTALVTMIFFLFQISCDGDVIIPDAQAMKDLFLPGGKTDEEDPEKARSLMSLRECVTSFLVGMERVFLATIVLTLAWASGGVMSSVGCDRLFPNWIVGGISPQSLPTLSFLISLFMALAVSVWHDALLKSALQQLFSNSFNFSRSLLQTGTSWGTMSILFPLLLVPTYDACNADPLIFYSTVVSCLEVLLVII